MVNSKLLDDKEIDFFMEIEKEIGFFEEFNKNIKV